MRAITDAMPFPPGVQRLGDHVYRPDEEVDYRENGWRRVQTWAAAQDKVIGTGWPAGLADVTRR